MIGDELYSLSWIGVGGGEIGGGWAEREGFLE